MKVSLVVPCFNEEQNVKAFYDTAVHDFDGAACDLQMVFVDDGSKDNTLSELKKLFEEDSERVKVVTFSRNFGKESAILAGISEADGDYITLIDADLQQLPSIAREMVEFLEDNPDYDCVAAYQGVRIEDKTLSLFKKQFYNLINKMSDVKFEQGASDFRTFRREVAETILNLPEYHRFSKGIFAWIGYKTKYIEYQAQERNAGKTSWSFRKLFKYAIEGIMAYSVKPLKFATTFGILSIIASLIWLIVDIIIVATGSGLHLVFVILLMLLFFCGVQLLSIGILSSYVSKIYIQSKNRPVYIVKKVYQK
jgi:glucosyltransferase